MRDYRMIIKKHREAMGLSQHRLAEQLGITQTFLSEIERGRKNPSLEQFFELCDALNIKLFPDEDQEGDQ